MRPAGTPIAVDKWYRTGDGELRRVTAITITGDVIFTSYPEGAVDAAVEGEHMPGVLFSQDIEHEVPPPSGVR